MNGASQISQADECRGGAFGARRAWFALYGLCLFVAAVLAGGLAMLSTAPAEAQQQPDLHGLIEIGGSDIKSVVLQLTRAEVDRIERAFNEREEPVKFRMIDSARKHTFDDVKVSAARPENTARVVDAVRQTAEMMRLDFNVPAERVYVVSSSGVAATPHYEDLKSRLKQQLPDAVVSQITADQECALTFRWITPSRLFREVVIIDVGSSNVKACYVDQAGRSGQLPNVRGFELLPLGTKSFADRVRARLQERQLPAGRFADVAQEMRRTELKPMLDHANRNHPGLSSLPRLYLAGGIVWATSNLTRPCPTDPYKTVFRVADIGTHAVRLRSGRAYDYDAACAKGQTENLARMEGTVNDIRRTFNQEDLIAGNELLQAMSEQLRFAEKKSIAFASVARDSWRSQLLADIIRQGPDKPLGPAPADSAIAQQVSRVVGEEMRRFDEKLKLLDQERQRLADLVQRLEAVAGRVTPAPDAGPVKIGVAVPMSGNDRAFGEHIALGVQEAVADLNATTGIAGRRMEVVVMDDKSSAEEGVAVAGRMAEQGVKIVIGHMNSGVTFPASKVYAEKGIVMITPSATNIAITDQQLWNVFRTCGRDDQQGEVAGKYIAERFVGKKVAFVHDGTLYGKGLAEQTLATIKGLGMSAVLFESVELKNSETLVDMARRIKTAGADVVYWGGLYEGGKLLRQMRNAGVGATMMSGDGIFADEFAELGGPGTEGTVMTYHPDWRQRARPEVKVLTDRLLAGNKRPGPYTYYSYAAMQIAVAAANEARTLDTRRIAEVMRSKRTGWPTIIGPIEFDGKGDITRQDYVMWTWQKGADGRITPVMN